MDDFSDARRSHMGLPLLVRRNNGRLGRPSMYLYHETKKHKSWLMHNTFFFHLRLLRLARPRVAIWARASQGCTVAEVGAENIDVQRTAAAFEALASADQSVQGLHGV